MIIPEVINEKEYQKRGVFVWRYLDLHKFISFIKNREIRFTRMDEFGDPLEGIPLRALVQYSADMALELIEDEKLSDLILDDNKINRLSPLMQKRILNIKKIQQSSFVSCWFLSKRESMAMWNLYSNSEGVAVCLRAGKLISHFKTDKALSEDSRIQALYCGKVRYQNFKRIDPYDDSNKIKVVLRKDESYSHENEFRLVIRSKSNSKLINSFSSTVPSLEDLNMMVVCHPQMAFWKKNNVRQLLEEINLGTAYRESEIRLRN